MMVEDTRAVFFKKISEINKSDQKREFCNSCDLKADNAELDRKIELYKKALLILGGELDKWKCPGEDADSDDEVVALIVNAAKTSATPALFRSAGKSTPSGRQRRS